LKNKNQTKYNSLRGIVSYLKQVNRKKKIAARKKGENEHRVSVNRNGRSKKPEYFSYYRQGFEKKIKLASKKKKSVDYGDLLKFLIPKYMEFSRVTLNPIENGRLLVPEVFSISENNVDSMFFLKRLFNTLYTERARSIVIDYKNCKVLDVDACAVMDLIIVGFRNYWDRCSNAKLPVHVESILLANWQTKQEVSDVLFSIGSFKNVAGIEQENPNPATIPFLIRIGDNKKDPNGQMKEIHETEIVDYVVACLKELNYDFSPTAEKNLSKVVGEIMANAEEHSKFRYRFAMGYFVKPKEINDDLGLFKLSIFNFGQTIYQSFKALEHADSPIVVQMRALSEEYTRRGFLFWKKRFKEEVLWTLYSLQEGVTSVQKWTRGKGTIRFIESFFKLGSSNSIGFRSKLTLISGNTRIIFDGTYPLAEKPGDTNKLKVMTFNEYNDIRELPDDKFVTFVPQTFFPGTLISAKIYITNHNIS
jgi:hypothetical protein